MDKQCSTLTVWAISWVILRPEVFVGHRPPVEGLRRALRAASRTRWRARVRRQGVVTKVSRRGVGAQRHGLLQAGHTGAVSAGEGQELVPGGVAVSRTAGVIFLAQI